MFIQSNVFVYLFLIVFIILLHYLCVHCFHIYVFIKPLVI